MAIDYSRIRHIIVRLSVYITKLSHSETYYQIKWQTEDGGPSDRSSGRISDSQNGLAGLCVSTWA